VDNLQGDTLRAKLDAAKAKFGHDQIYVTGSDSFVQRTVRAADEGGIEVRWADKRSKAAAGELVQERTAAAATPVLAPADTAELARKDWTSDDEGYTPPQEPTQERAAPRPTPFAQDDEPGIRR